jgi:hypothetical protein
MFAAAMHATRSAPTPYAAALPEVIVWFRTVRGLF